MWHGTPRSEPDMTKDIECVELCPAKTSKLDKLNHVADGSSSMCYSLSQIHFPLNCTSTFRSVRLFGDPTSPVRAPRFWALETNGNMVEV